MRLYSVTVHVSKINAFADRPKKNEVTEQFYNFEVIRNSVGKSCKIEKEIRG